MKDTEDSVVDIGSRIEVDESDKEGPRQWVLMKMIVAGGMLVKRGEELIKEGESLQARARNALRKWNVTPK